MKITKLHEMAINWAKAGWKVFPCERRGKKPLCKNGCKDATCDVAQINRWWWTWPDANIGLATGSVNALIVLDVDGDAGEASLEALLRDNYICTCEIATGRGRQFYFYYAAGDIHNSAGRIGKGLDIRGEGGYVIAPPSIHENGKQYAQTLGTHMPANLPGWLAHMAMPPKSDTITPPPVRQIPMRITNTGRLLRRAWAYVAAVQGVSEGGRNQKLFAVAGHLASLVGMAGTKLDEGEIVAAVRDLNHRCMPPVKEKELLATVRSALRNGTPRDLKPNRNLHESHRRDIKQARK
jgi:hypothetical protein